MKLKEFKKKLKELDKKEFRGELKENLDLLRTKRFDAELKKLKNYKEIGQIKKKIARILTILVISEFEKLRDNTGARSADVQKKEEKGENNG